MPLPLRRVEPIHVSRGTLPDRVSVPNDLEAVANGTLANVIVQLSSLSHHAEELFGDLIRVGSEIASRANNLQARIDRLAVKVTQMDNTPEESTSMHEALNTKPFQSSIAVDQQVVARCTLPPALVKTFETCDKPPPLDRLNSYRDDGKDGLKFYTDANYFFNLWRHQMLRDTEKVIKKPHKPKHEGGQRHKKRVRQPTNTRERHKHIAIEQGEHIMAGVEYRPPNAAPEVPDGAVYPADPNVQYGHGHNSRNMTPRPSNIELDSKGYPAEAPYGNGVIANNRDEFRNNQDHHANFVHRNNSHNSHYDHYDPYGHNHSMTSMAQQQRYYAHGTPPPAYSDGSSPSSNAYSTPRSNSGISTPRGISSNYNNLIANNMTNGGSRPSQPPPAPPPVFMGNTSSSYGGTPTRNARAQSSRETLPPPPPPPLELEHNGTPMSNHHYQDRHNSMPPPPPLDDENEEPLPPPPPTPDQDLHHHNVRHIANLDDHLPPSPPPPPPDVPAPPAPPMPTLQAPNVNGNIVKADTKAKSKNTPAPAWDGRSELLKAIRNGIELRKVDNRKEPNKEDKGGAAYCDVASILARRVAVEMSDSDSGSESESDSDGWDETSA